MKRARPMTAAELVDRAKAELAAGDHRAATTNALIAIADLLNQWLQPELAETDETPELHWPTTQQEQT